MVLRLVATGDGHVVLMNFQTNFAEKKKMEMFIFLASSILMPEKQAEIIHLFFAPFVKLTFHRPRNGIPR